MDTNMDDLWDCLIVGGGAAGSSAALVLGRARRTTLLVDAGAPSNAPAPGIGGLLGHDGRPPLELLAMGRAELRQYPSVATVEGAVVDARPVDGGFVVELADGAAVRARRLLLAEGARYDHADIDGLRERWGRSAFHCPFCHGWEVRDRALAVIDAGPTADHRARLLRGWSDSVIVLADGPSQLDADARRSLAELGVAVDERPIAALEGPAPDLEAVRFADGTTLAVEAALVAVQLRPRSPLARRLGVDVGPLGPIATEAILTGPMGDTSVPGVFAAGDAAAANPSVAGAIATGSTAAAGVVASLMGEPDWPSAR
jgi:thioredoxin reductase